MSRRRVAVEFIAEMARFRRGMRDGADDVRKLKDESKSAQGEIADMGETAAKSGLEVAAAGRKASGALSGLAKDAADLDRRIIDTRGSIRDLAREIARTSDEAGRAKLVEKLTADRGKLRDLMDLRKLIDFDGAGAKGAEEFSLGFAGRIGPMIARAPLSPGLVAAAAGAAPLVANVLAGAVVGGIATGVTGIGVAIASQDAEVRSAAKGLAGEIGNTLRDAAKPFVPATIGAIGIVRDEFRAMGDDLEGIFDSASGYVEPLTRAAVGFVREMVPGIRDAVDKAEPFFTMLGQELPELGQDVGELFSTMADHADDGAAAVGQMLDLMGGVADATGLVVDGLALLKDIGAIDPGADKGTHWADKHFGNLESKMVRLKPASEVAAEGINRVGVAAEGLETRAADSAREVETLAETIDRLAGANMSVEQANIRLEESIDRATEAAQRNGDGIDANHPKQRANRQALIDIASASNEAYDKTLELTGSEHEAAEAAQRGRDKFMELADKMGVSKAAAVLLADKLFKIPDRNVKVTANTAAALAAALALQARINNMSARINVFAEPSGGFGGGKGTGFGYSTGQRWGGVYEHAEVGLLREAQTYSPRNPGRYMMAEPATLGEAFIPKNGNRERSVSIGRRAMEWYGMDVVPKGAMQAVWGTAMSLATSQAPAGPVTYDNRAYIYPQKADFTTQDLERAQRRQETRARVGRPR